MFDRPDTGRPLKIACLGECMIELADFSIPEGRSKVSVAGDTLNTAIYLARLLPSDVAEISYLTALGDDPLSGALMDQIAGEGVRTDHIARRAGMLPGLYAIETDPTGERRFHYWRQNSAARGMFAPGALTLSQVAAFDIIYLSGISLAILPEDHRAALIAALGAAQAAGTQVEFDSNYRPALWPDPETARSSISNMWSVSTLGLPSIDDEAALFDETDDAHTMTRLLGVGAGEMVLKRGASWPCIAADGAWRAIETQPVTEVVDSTAAGDSFNAGYIAARVAGHTPAEAAARGHAVAAEVIRWKGAIIPKDALGNDLI